MDILGQCRNWLNNYVRIVSSPCLENTNKKQDELTLWKNRLFIQFLLYCFPVGLIAVIPCVIVSFEVGYLMTGIIDLACFLLITFVTFSPKLSLLNKKYCVIIMFYVLAVFLTANLGYDGPGVFYLLSITLFVALFFPIRQAYLSIGINVCIIATFGVEIYFNLFKSAVMQQYTIEQWLAFSSNLIFISIILVILIQKIFRGLQTTIENKESIKAKYQTIFDHSPLPMWLFDIDTLRFLDVNRAAIAHYGYSKSEFLGMTIKDIRPSEDIADIEKMVNGNRGNYKFHHDTVRHLKKNGECIFVRIESSLLEFNGHQAKLVLASDITQQLENKAEALQSNEKVKQSESNLRAIFESAIQGFVLLDQHDCIIISNQKANNSILVGSNFSEFQKGESIYNYVDGSRLDNFKDYLSRVRSGEIIEYDRKYVIGTQALWIHYSLTPVYHEKRITGTCITGEDITGQKMYLEKIEDQNRILKEISWIQSHVARAPLARMMALTNLILCETREQDKMEMIGLLDITAKEFDQAIKEVTAKIANNNYEIL